MKILLIIITYTCFLIFHYILSLAAGAKKEIPSALPFFSEVTKLFAAFIIGLMIAEVMA